MSKSPSVVLVVEDEMILRLRAVEVVEDAGFVPLEATNADEAIAVLESRSDVSLLFTDIQMPGSMDGLKLAHAVHGRWPHIKIILVSGRVVVSDAERPAHSKFFGKPIATQQMIAELKDMVGAGALTIVPEVTPGFIVQGKEEVLEAENAGLRLLLEQAVVNAQVLLEEAGIEAKEREAANKLQLLIRDELHHRIKNTIATISAIASQSLRAASSIEQGKQAIECRLAALGGAHDLLLQTSWATAGLKETVLSAIRTFQNSEASNFRVDGPQIMMPSGAVIALAMTFNELCTNALKFGALSRPDGYVSISWRVHNDTQRLQLSWSEVGGPPVSEPTRRSFGSRLIRSLGIQLNGSVLFDYAPAGFQYGLDVPTSAVVYAH